MMTYFATLGPDGVLRLDTDPLAQLGEGVLPPAAQAVVASLYSDARADEGDVLPDGGTDRRGWWGDTFAASPDDAIGSRLWLLRRAKASEATVAQAVAYAREALAWIVPAGLAKSVTVAGQLTAAGRVDLSVTIDRDVLRFSEAWGA